MSQKKPYLENSDPSLQSQEDNEMLNASRRNFFMGLILPFSMAMNTCTDSATSPADQVAEQYMKAYYIEYDVKKALPLTEGLAKDKLANELNLSEEAHNEGPLPKPPADFTLQSKKEEGPQEVSYTYIVEIKQQDIPAHKIYLKLRQQDSQGWKVSQVIEFEPGQGPDSP